MQKRYPVGTQLNEKEREMLTNMLQIEREKLKKVYPDAEPEKVINDAQFMRDLIRKEYKRRQYKKN